MACILPNINPKLLSGEDFINVLKEKLQEPKFNENEYIIYEIKTEVFTSYQKVFQRTKTKKGQMSYGIPKEIRTFYVFKVLI